MEETAIAERVDADIVAAVLAGDLPAFAELVRRHAATAKRAAALWGAGSDADDVVQEAFVKAYTALGRYRHGSPFRPWLLRIVRNETYNLRRSRVRRSQREEGSAWPGQLPVDPAMAVLTADRRASLVTALRALPDELQDVVTCRYLLELTEAETATTLGIPAGTVKSRLSRALARLREEVRDDRV